MYGIYNFNLNLNKFVDEYNLLNETAKPKIKGDKGHNKFYKVSTNTKEELANYVTEAIGKKFDWGFDFFISGEPVGLHTDYTVVPWNDEVSCRVDVGVIIPIEWNCKQPYTLSYNKSAIKPVKVMFNGKELVDDNGNIIHYREKYEYDPKIFKYHPEGTPHLIQYADLKIDEVFEWTKGSMYVFDTKKWHSSSWFLSTDHIPDTSVEHKFFIVGFGSVDIPKGSYE
jgi:hypothetical protein